MASPEEDELELARARAKAKMRNRYSPFAGPGRERPPEAVEQGSGPAHVAKGLGEAAFGVANLPNTLSRLARGGIDKAAQAFGFEEGPNLTEMTEPYIGEASKAFGWHPALAPPIYPKAQDLPYGQEVYDAVASEEPGMEGTPWDLGRTGIEWGAALPYSAAKGAKYGTDLITGTGAMTGQYLAEKFGGDSTTGELAGGGLALIAALRRGRAPKTDTSALDYIESNVDNMDDLARAAEDAVRTKKAGTLADISGDQRMYDVERGVADFDQNAVREIDRITASREAQLAQAIKEPLGTAKQGPELAAARARVQATQNKIANAKAQGVADINASVPARQQPIDQGLEQATLAARQADDAALAAQQATTEAGRPLQTTDRVDQASGKLQETINDAAKQSYADNVQPLWDEFDALESVPTLPIKTAISDVMKSMTKTQRADFSETYGRLFKRFRGKGSDDMLPADVQTQIRRMKDEVTSRYKNGNVTPESAALDDMVKAIEAKMIAENPVYGAAKKATKDFHEQYNPEKLGDLRNKAAPETFARNMSLADEAGAQTARNINTANVPGAPEGLSNTLRAMGQKGGVDDKFLGKYEAVLDDVVPPQEAQQFRNFVETGKRQKAAEEAAKQAAKQQATATTTARKESAKLEKAVAAEVSAKEAKSTARQVALDKTMVARYAKSPEGELNKLITGKDKTNELKRLYDANVRMGTDAEFKGAIRDKLLTNKDMAKHKQRLVDAEVISEAESKYIDELLASGENITRMRKQAVSKMMGDLVGSEKRNILSSAMASGFLRFIPTGHALMMGNVMKRAFSRMLAGSADSKQLKVLESFMLDPEKYLKAAENAKTATEANRLIMTKLVGASKAEELLSEEEQY